MAIIDDFLFSFEFVFYLYSLFYYFFLLLLPTTTTTTTCTYQINNQHVVVIKSNIIQQKFTISTSPILPNILLICKTKKKIYKTPIFILLNWNYHYENNHKIDLSTINCASYTTFNYHYYQIYTPII